MGLSCIATEAVDVPARFPRVVTTGVVRFRGKIPYRKPRLTNIVGDQESPGNCHGSSNVAWNPDWDPNELDLELSLL